MPGAFKSGQDARSSTKGTLLKFEKVLIMTDKFGGDDYFPIAGGYDAFFAYLL